jgi:Stress responsive A/B Barrel Domain
MKKQTRRQFVQKAGQAFAITGLLSFGNSNASAMPAKNLFVHHVYFWLKNPGSKEDLLKLLDGLQKLSSVKTIKMFHIGKPADTNRDVIERTYAVSWLLLFENKADQESYQEDPIHKKFIADCSSVWSKVIVYDSVDA